MKKVRSKLRPTEIGVIKTFSLSPDDEIGEIAVECIGCTYYYNNLAELCAKWEDAPEEPDKYWFIDPEGEVASMNEEYEDKESTNATKEIGNYFETKEEAEKAREKLKAWKRLKDKGFRFTGIEDVERTIHFEIPFRAGYGSCEAEVNLDFLFGGEK